MIEVPLQERAAARTSVAFLAMPWRGLLSIRGPDAGAFLQGMLTQNLAGMEPGDVRRTCLVDRKARLVAEGWIRREPEGFQLVAPHAPILEVASTFDRHLIREQVEILPSQEARIWLVCGPQAPAALERCALRSQAWPVLETWAEPGADFLLVAEEEAQARGLAERLQGAGIREIGEATFDRLRIEAGHARWGLDMGPGDFPMEVGLDAALSYEKGCYLGQETIARAHYRGHMNRGLLGVRFPSAASPPALQTPILHDGVEIGRVTSAAFAPKGDDVLALGMVARASAVPGTPVVAGGLAGRLETLPFEEARPG